MELGTLRRWLKLDDRAVSSCLGPVYLPTTSAFSKEFTPLISKTILSQQCLQYAYLERLELYRFFRLRDKVAFACKDDMPALMMQPIQQAMSTRTERYHRQNRPSEPW